jgi:hypothetical protein
MGMGLKGLVKSFRGTKKANRVFERFAFLFFPSATDHTPFAFGNHFSDGTVWAEVN